MSFDIERIIQTVSEASRCKITVMGDYCLDKYLYIDPARDEPSVETGLTAYQVHRKALYAGVGGTIANNLRALGARVGCVGLVGMDGEGYDLMACLEKIGAETRGMVLSRQICTSTYVKPMRKGKSGHYTEMNRFDSRNFNPTPPDLQEQLLEALLASAEDSHAVIVTDQFLERDYSAVTTHIRKKVSEMARQMPEKFFYADSRGFVDEYRSMLVKCNHLEVVRCIRPEHNGEISQEMVLECGRQVALRNERPVFVTMGERGSLVFEEGRVQEIPAFPVIGPVDIVGAGDATNAGIVLGLSLGLSPAEAALVGNCVASLTIQQIGVTGTATMEQVRERLSSLQAQASALR
ncbi:PfkB family carbohydrate kinase [Oscillospiraceae bacterium MB08-C2-2]|nr:PfkB family carbohydrate kinase [Oscillospiraceae bacterium MB08-C2-2]